MIIEYVGVKEINGSLVVIDGVKGASYEEIVDIRLDNGAVRQGRIVQIEGDRVVVQVFEGTEGHDTARGAGDGGQAGLASEAGVGGCMPGNACSASPGRWTNAGGNTGFVGHFVAGYARRYARPWQYGQLPGDCHLYSADAFCSAPAGVGPAKPADASAE